MFANAFLTQAEGDLLVFTPHHVTYGGLKAATELGCNICSDSVASRLKFRATEFVFVKADTQGIYLIIRPSPSGALRELNENDVFAVKPTTSTIVAAARSASTQTFTGHPSVLNLGKHWLHNCLEQHAGCRRYAKPERYPTRLLELSHGYVRLVKSAERLPEGPYATLSHCWGLEAFFKLTPDTLDTLRHGVSTTILPLSFQHAIIVTLALGIEWLWIDCYCILQGEDESSKQDWDKESGLMSSVYAGGLINLGICHARNPHEGAFVSRSCAEMYTTVVEWRQDSDRELGQYYVCRLPLGSGRSLWDSTMLSRAWCVQERLLSRRMLYFAADQIYWECGEQQDCCEQWPEGLVEGPSASGYPFSLMASAKASTSIRRSSKNTLFLQYQAWSQVLQHYTRAVLTYPDQDKLKAIQGIADQAQEVFNTKHRWGFLEDTLPIVICFWFDLQDVSPARSQRAPSRSWASFNDPIHLVSFDDPVPFRRLIWHDFEFFKFLSCAMGCQHDFPLFCMGKPLHVEAEPWELEAQSWGPKWMKLLSGSLPGSTFRVLAYLDMRMQLPLGAVALPTFEYARSPGWRGPPVRYGLLLKEQANGCFQRLGRWSTPYNSSNVEVESQVMGSAAARLMVLV